jgi:hypothetical protein
LTVVDIRRLAQTRVLAADYNWQVTQPGIIKLRTLSGQPPLAPVMSSG